MENTSAFVCSIPNAGDIFQKKSRKKTIDSKTDVAGNGTGIHPKPMKVLHIGADNVGFGGRSVIAFNLTQMMDESRVRNDFLVFHEITQQEYIDALKKKKSKYVEIHINSRLPKLIRKIKRTLTMAHVMKVEEYDLIHIHADHAYEAMCNIGAGKLAGINRFVIHAHTTGGDSKFSKLKKQIILKCQRRLSKENYLQLACSDEAAEYFFGRKNKNNTIILKNGIDIKKFIYHSDSKLEIRKKLGYKEQLIVGNIGRFSPQKNHFFILDVFAEILNRSPSARLMLIGDGELRTDVENAAKRKGIYESVDFLGNRNDVPDLLQAMDVFLLPSLYEGFGIVNLEAQCTGLPCVVSTEVPRMVKVTDLVQFIPLSEDPDVWADAVCKKADIAVRKSRETELIRAGYDITASAAQLQKLYEDIGRI